MIKYPLSFFGSSIASHGMSDSWTSKASGHTTMVSIPQEFEGSGGEFSPEDLYLLALQNCFVATFKVYAQYSRLEFENLEVQTELIVDKNELNKPVMREVKLKIQILKPSDQKKANLLVNKTLENGFILQSVKTTITHEVNIVA